jgi:hypothetical protein
MALAVATLVSCGRGPRPATRSSPQSPTLAVRTASSADASNCPIVMAPADGDNAARLQAALDSASAGDCAELRLGAGSFEISSPLILGSGVRLTGQRYKRTFSILRPTRGFQGKALLVAAAAARNSQEERAGIFVENVRLDARPECPSRTDCAPASVEVGVWLHGTAYATLRDSEFSRFPESGAAVRGTDLRYLKILDCRFLSNRGWSLDLASERAEPAPHGARVPADYAVYLGAIHSNYFATRRGIRLTSGMSVSIRDNQFEGGLSMIHAYEATSSMLNIEDNYFEVGIQPEDVPDHGTIAVKGTGRIVGNLMFGPAKGKLPRYQGPGIEVVGSTSMTIEDNTIRRFDPAVRVRGLSDPSMVRDAGNVIGPKAHVVNPWDFPNRRPVPSVDALDLQEPN